MPAKAEQLSSVIENDRGMVLLGAAVKKFLTFRVVSVQLYVAKDHSTDEILADIAKRLEVTYHLNIPKYELDRATIKGIEKNVDAQKLADLMPAINQINSYYPDVKSGDQIVIAYTPGVGSKVLLNGQLKGVVPGADFARAFFAIWVGDKPVDERAKLKLLGKANRRIVKGDDRE